MFDTERQDIEPRFAQMLDILHAGGNYAYWWNRDPATGHKRSEWWETGKRTNPVNGVVDAYFGIHPTTEIPDTNRRGVETAPEHVRSQIKYIASINALFGEYDANKHGNDKHATLMALENVKPTPSAIVDSGGGYHAYWFLSETWHLNTPDERERAIDIQARWVNFVGSDPASKDLARVLRVPGTHNLKYDHKPLVQFVKFDASLTYDLEYLVSLLPETAAPLAPVVATSHITTDNRRIAPYVDKAYRDEIANVVLSTNGEKHPILRDAAVKIGSILHYGIDENEAFNALHNAIAAKAKDIKRADDTIRDGLAYGKTNPRNLEEKLTKPHPGFDSDGMPRCPQCGDALFHAKSKDVWGCKTCIDVGKPFWWDGNGYQPVNLVSTPVSTPVSTDHQPVVKHRRLWYSEDELSSIRLPHYLIDGVIVFGETTVVFGPSDAGKTFIVVDMVMRAAQHYPIMYVAGEDMPGVRLRKLAWQQHYHRQPNGNFRMWHGEFSLFDNEQVNTFIVQNRAADTKLIVFDTLSQCSIGADENSNTAMAMVMHNCNRIAHEVGAAVVVIHHTTKQETNYRGAAAIKGNTYGFLSVEKQDEAIKLECVRIKNSPVFPDRYFRLVDVVVDGVVDNKGMPVGSCVIRPSKQVIRSEKLSKVQQKVLETIGIITKAQGKASAADAMNSLELKGNSFYKPLNVLLDKNHVARLTTKQGNASGYIITEDGRQYLINAAHNSNPVVSDDDITTELFTVNPIKTEVDGAVNELTQRLTPQNSERLTNGLIQVDEPSEYTPLAGY